MSSGADKQPQATHPISTVGAGAWRLASRVAAPARWAADLLGRRAPGIGATLAATAARFARRRLALGPSTRPLLRRLATPAESYQDDTRAAWLRRTHRSTTLAARPTAFPAEDTSAGPTAPPHGSHSAPGATARRALVTPLLHAPAATLPEADTSAGPTAPPPGANSSRRALVTPLTHTATTLPEADTSAGPTATPHGSHSAPGATGRRTLVTPLLRAPATTPPEAETSAGPTATPYGTHSAPGSTGRRALATPLLLRAPAPPTTTATPGTPGGLTGPDSLAVEETGPARARARPPATPGSPAGHARAEGGRSRPAVQAGPTESGRAWPAADLAEAQRAPAMPGGASAPPEPSAPVAGGAEPPLLPFLEPILRRATPPAGATPLVPATRSTFAPALLRTRASSSSPTTSAAATLPFGASPRAAELPGEAHPEAALAATNIPAEAQADRPALRATARPGGTGTRATPAPRGSAVLPLLETPWSAAGVPGGARASGAPGTTPPPATSAAWSLPLLRTVVADPVAWPANEPDEPGGPDHHQALMRGPGQPASAAAPGPARRRASAILPVLGGAPTRPDMAETARPLVLDEIPRRSMATAAPGGTGATTRVAPRDIATGAPLPLLQRAPAPATDDLIDPAAIPPPRLTPAATGPTGLAGSAPAPLIASGRAGGARSALGTTASLDLLRPIAPAQRALDGAEAAPDAPTQTISASSGGNEQTTQPPAVPDIDALAQQVYERLRARLRIDQERLGRY